MSFAYIKKMMLVTVILLFMIVITACGQISDKSNNDVENDSEDSNDTSTEEVDADESKEYLIGWSTIYLTPSWMQQTNEMLIERSEYWNENGMKNKVEVANANGDTSVQISQIENMISQNYDAILVVAGSSTALNPVVEKAMDAGIKVIGFDSLPSTDNMTSKINTDTKQWGKLTAEWLVNEMDEEGKVIAMNGPAGVSVSEERWEGAKDVFDQYPDIEIVATLNSEYNEGPALEAILPALDANKDIKGIFSQGGAFSSAALKALQQKDMDLVPITGENYNGYLNQWFELKDEGFTSIAPAQPNWLAVLALDQALRALEGHDVDDNVIVDPPIIDPDNLDEFLPNELSDDYFVIKDITDEQIEEILGPME